MLNRVETGEPSLVPLTVRGSETILRVEDQEQVRGVACAILKRSGYCVLVAESAGDALLLCEKHAAPIDLLVTDVVMPRMNGSELAARLAVLRPEMRVLWKVRHTSIALKYYAIADPGLGPSPMLDFSAMSPPVSP